MLEVVEQEQQLLLLQVFGERFERRLARLLARAERPQDRGHDKLPVADGRERDEEDAVTKPVQDVRRELQREPGLPGASRPDQGEQPYVLPLEQRACLGELALAADERVRLGGQ